MGRTPQTRSQTPVHVLGALVTATTTFLNLATAVRDRSQIRAVVCCAILTSCVGMLWWDARSLARDPRTSEAGDQVQCRMDGVAAEALPEADRTAAPVESTQVGVDPQRAQLDSAVALDGVGDCRQMPVEV